MALPPSSEEISTIFVVGFPEDMQEREFQNMFLFCPGFEAATLKIPQKAEGEENNARKQIIGFAKFRTRREAMDARDLLSGRKIDHEKGCILKAEMAKKNLHTKRTGDYPKHLPPMLASPLSAENGFGSLASKRLVPPPSVVPTPYDPMLSVSLVSPLLNELLSPSEHPEFFADVLTTPTASNNPSVSNSTVARNPTLELRDTSLSTLVTQRAQRAANMGGSGGNGFPSRVGVGALGVGNGARGVFHEAEDIIGTNVDYLSKSTPALSSGSSSSSSTTSNGIGASTNINSYGSVSGYGTSSLWSLDDLPPMPHSARFPSLSSFGGLASPPPSSPGMTPPGFNGPHLPVSSNPADQNPPCNTLYVGNLPHSTNEEELRQLFSKCSGYKRLSFRTKSNGPMCFVEFEGVDYAMRALTELQGAMLNSSNRGGIRLSFSKNPLGVRAQSMSNGGTGGAIPPTPQHSQSHPSTPTTSQAPGSHLRQSSADRFEQLRSPVSALGYEREGMPFTFGTQL
ncbi:uncharacterized protein VTP21DRAFT_6840 [Calcarisporiella thermophila]|uniref:uncharacterized protein n=1 Tax=Calcarisporiella thermophila TaxID=911321 RepID=UPI0037429237